MQTYFLSEASKKIGVAPITLKRWLLEEKVPEVQRDQNGGRVFSDQDIRKIRRQIFGEQNLNKSVQNTLIFEDSQKLRGGYYTHEIVAQWLSDWAIQTADDSVLEPSCGDGSFISAAIHSLLRHGAKEKDTLSHITGIEINAEEYRKCITKHKCKILHADFFQWFQENSSSKKFDCVVGNPPFIRYQNFPEPSRTIAMDEMGRLGLKPNRLTNSWVPFVALSSTLLKENGRLAMVLPAELLQVSYAAQLREYLVDHFGSLEIIACNELIFEGAQQEVVLLLASEYSSTVPKKSRCKIDFLETQTLHSIPAVRSKRKQTSKKHVDHKNEKWLKYFLDANEIQLMRDLRLGRLATSLISHATVDVGVVTGNNAYFVLTFSEMQEWGISSYCIPMVGRSAQMQGAVMDDEIFSQLSSDDSKVYLLSLSPSISNIPGQLKKYLDFGESQAVPKGYKCSVRKQWYSVPSIWSPDFFLFRQIYDFPRIVKNEIAATSTDTIHRLSCQIDKDVFASNFYTYLTAASAEIEGRSYGGGVLELEPTEAERLLMPFTPLTNGLHIQEIHSMLLSHGIDEVLETNSAIILKRLGLSKKEISQLKNIWIKMRERRCKRRNQSES